MDVDVLQLGIVVEEGEGAADLEHAPGQVVLPLGSPVHQLLQVLLERATGSVANNTLSSVSTLYT